MVAIVALVAGIVLGATVNKVQEDDIVSRFSAIHDRTFEIHNDLNNASYIQTDLLSRMMHYVSGHDASKKAIVGCPVCGGAPRDNEGLKRITLLPEPRSLEQALLDAEENKGAVTRTLGQVVTRIAVMNRLLEYLGDE